MDCYQQYQLHWLAANGFSLCDFLVSIQQAEDQFNLHHKDAEDVMLVWEENGGFEGPVDGSCRIYDNVEQFLGTKYKDKVFMQKLLDVKQYSQYLAYEYPGGEKPVMEGGSV